MNKILNMKLFRLLAETSPVTNQEMEDAYGRFTEHMRTVSQSEINFPELFRMLNITRIELVFLQSLYRYEEGEKCLENCLLCKNYPTSRIRNRTT